MAEQPPLNRSYVISYAGNDRDYPVIGLRLDPRVAGYRVPEDLSPHPDSKRYPNHVFTGSQPSNGDERVTHVYEILPAPWVPFTRYDDDLGPVQGRRRSVKNEGQQASLTSSTKTSYEGREGSAIVSNEIEETWSIKVDEDGNSLFPIKDRDFYDASRGAVQERRQLFVPTGEEVGTLENVGGVITQTSYEPYNEFLSVKIFQTYKTDGPQLIGNTTDNDGQLVTVTTQRKAALDYVPPNPTATRTVEISREDAESLIERIIDTPEVFKADTFSVERPDPIPQKFRVAVPIKSSQEVVEGKAGIPVLGSGEISRSEEQRNKFLKRVSATSRDQTVLPQTLLQKSTNNERQEVTVTETLQSGDTKEVATATKTIESEALGDGNYVVRKTEIPEVFAGEIYRKTKEDLTPQKFRASQEEDIFEETIEGTAESPTLGSGEFAKSEQQVDKFTKRISTTFRDIEVATSLDEEVVTPEGIIAKRTLRLSKDAQSINPDEKLIDGSIEALGDGRTIKTEVRVPKIFTGKTFSVERPDVIPQKFRADAPITTKQETVVGEAEEPTLSQDVVSKTEQQTTEFLKRVSTSFRENVNLSRVLTQKSTTNDRQLATITERIENGDTSESPSATKEVQSEALGDGKYLVRITEVDEVFPAKTIRASKLDITPEKFKAKEVSTTLEVTEKGEISDAIELGEGEFEKTEQQINPFTKRTTTTSRDTETISTIEEKVLTNEGQLATRTLTLTDSSQQINPDETLIDASIEALGDGRTVKTEVRVDKIFDAKQESKQKPDIIPAEFRASLPDVTTIEVRAGDDVKIGALAEDEVSKTIQRIDEYKVRETKTVRQNGPYQQLVDEIVDNDGLIITRSKTVVDGDQTITPSATVSGTVQSLGDGYTLKIEDTKNKIFAGRVYSQEKPDTVPLEFRAEKPSTTEEFNEEGEASEVSLSDIEISRSEQQITEFVKKVRKTTRDLTTGATLNGEQIDENGIKVKVKRTLAQGAQSVVPSATVSGQVEAIGDGKTIKTELEKLEVFSEQVFSKEKPDNIPVEFRAELPAVVDEKTVIGDVEPPSLEGDEISKSEQQITKFLKRVRTTTRENVDEVELIGEQINQNKQKVKITRTLKKGSQSITPSATISGDIQPLGDGYTIKTEQEIPETFDQKIVSKERPDTTPLKFRTEIPTLTEEETFNKLDLSEEDVELLDDELSKSIQQVDKFTQRKRTTSRNTDESVSLIGQTLTTDLNGGIANVFETYGNNENLTNEFGTVSAEKETLGSNKVLIRKVILQPQQRTGQEYDEIFDVSIPFRRDVVRAGELDPTGSSEIQPRDNVHSIKTTYEKELIKENILQKHIRSADVVNISLPDVLNSVDFAVSSIITDPNDTSTSTASGITTSIDEKTEIEYDISPVINITNGYSGPAPAIRHYFFLEDNLCDESQVLAKTNSSPWPRFKPQSSTLVLSVNTTNSYFSYQRSLPDNEKKSIFSISKSRLVTINIGPTINGSINIAPFPPAGQSKIVSVESADKPEPYEGKFERVSKILSSNSNVSVVKNTIRPTEVTSIPNGNFLYSVSIRPYKYGLVQVEAITVNLTFYD
jgi:hypothetical protein